MRLCKRAVLLLMLVQVVRPFRALAEEGVAASQPAGAGLHLPGFRQDPDTASSTDAGPGAPADAGDDAFAPKRKAPLHLSISELWVGMDADYEFRRVRSDTPQTRSGTQENRNTRIQEKMGISLAGDIYDPNLIDYRAALIFGLSQNRYKEKSGYWRETDTDDGMLFQWDVSADLLKSKPLSFNVYTRRADIRVPRRFLPSLHELQTESGASALLQAGPTTTEFGFGYRDVERRGNRLESDDETIRLHRFYIDHKWAISDSQNLTANFTHEREEDDYQGSLYRFNTGRDELRLTHDLAFGDRKQHRLDTFLRYNEETGDFARDEIELVPRLTLQHTDKFKTVTRFGFYRFEQDAIRITQNKVDLQALYQATKDLRFTGNVFALHERIDQDVDTNQYGLMGDVTYQKSSSAGDFSANLNVGYDQARTDGSAGRRYVRNEAHALSNVRPTLLRERHVIQSSVIIHDDRFTRVYVLGSDYTLTRVGDRILINRVPWGRIADGDVVYADYQYEVPADGRLNTYRADFRIEHTFPFGLTPYYYFESRFQEVDCRSMGSPLYRDNQNRHRLGVRYAKDRWTVTGEYEIYDDTVEPYDAFHLTGQANVFRKAEHSLDLRGEVSRYNFEGSYDNRNVWFLDLDVKDRIQINDFLSITTGAGFQHQDDSVRGKTRGIDLNAGLQYTRGALTVELNLEYDMLSVVSNRENGFGLYLNIRRDLSYLVPASLRGGRR